MRSRVECDAGVRTGRARQEAEQAAGTPRMVDTKKETPVAVPEELLAAIEGMSRPVVIGHVRPDADCLASMLAVARTWLVGGAQGANVCLPPGSVSHRLEFLVEWADLPVAGAEVLAEADGFVVVDTAGRRRCNVGRGTPDNWSAGRAVVNIDHHRSNTVFGDVNWVVGDASSSAELVYHAIRAAGQTITPLVASLLYAGLHSDTRGFTTGETGGRSLAVAAELARAGANREEIGKRLYRSLRTCELELLRTVHANTRLTAGGRIAYSTADHEQITAAGCLAEDIDEQVEVPRLLGGIALAILFSEGEPGRVRTNLRAEPGFSVLPLAEALGGGGHSQAAGVVLECSLPEAVGRVIPLAEKFLDQQRLAHSAGG